ncbi:YqcI/YcgG family protein [Streptomyces sp. NRRL B-24484]|uniref:YqcI/YcgG family protein n=1 Tax=Streptomyces sp. NRRL B-24484 TaxID=1463833 RepID=UPI0009989307|nr:YqcI/YcgG family protein [Streptomyces sp. NRRL B-24484]
MNIGHAQVTVRRMVQAISQGYWKPTSAAFYLYEHAVELDDISGDSPDGDDLAEHLIEIFVTSICIADQYSVALNGAYRASGMNASIEAEFEQRKNGPDIDLAGAIKEVKRLTSEVARIITFYELDRLPTNPGKFRSLADAIPVLHAAIIQSFTKIDMPFEQAFFKKLDNATDSQRFDRYFDPGTAPCLDAFLRIKDRSQCIFASQSRIWGAPTYVPTESLQENLSSSLPFLTSFVRVAQREHLDGFLFAFPVGVFLGDIPSLSRLIKTLVVFLMANDPAGPRPFSRDEATSEGWHFSFDNEDFFINVFSPCYGYTHSRYTHGINDWIFVLLQPNSSFHHKMPRDRASANIQQIRDAFQNVYQGYEHQNLEAHRFVLPENHADPPVAWYDAPEFVEKVGGYVTPPSSEG